MNKKWKVTYYVIASLALVVFAFIIFEGVVQKNESAEKDVTKEEKSEQTIANASDSNDLPSLESFEPTTVPPGSKGTYELSYELNEEDWFTVHASIDVENLSEDEWDKIAFYLIPNAFTEENKSQNMGMASLELNMGEIAVNGKQVHYELDNNNLFVQLAEKLAPEDSANVEISYEMKIPGNSVRLRADGGGYYLVYSYPMLATYQESEWNIEHFNSNGESYHTSYGDYTAHYDLPEDYYVVSSANDGDTTPHSSGTIKGEDIKDFYIAFLDPVTWVTETDKSDNNVTLRAFVRHTDEQTLHSSLGYMKEALHFFEQNIGEYPSEELDLVSNGGGMEYPFVIEGYDNTTDQQAIENVIAHEIGHQYFYHSVSNDPFKEAWIDEGLTEFIVSLYTLDRYKAETLATWRAEAFTKDVDRIAVNQTIEEFQVDYGTGAYGMPSLQLWNYFDSEGAIEDAKDFLATYYETYYHKQVTTEEFIRFFEVYHGKHEHDYFDKWMDIDWSIVH